MYLYKAMMWVHWVPSPTYMSTSRRFIARLNFATLASSLVLSSFASVLPAFVPMAEAAPLSVTAATGGGAIDAATTGGVYTSLTGPSLNEGAAGDIGVGTIILNVPAGFEFDTGGTAPTVKLTSGDADATKNTNHLANNRPAA